MSLKRKILVVDDEHLVADTLGIIFEKRGFDCRVSYNGAEALACMEEFDPELLLCDMSMPGMSGLEVVVNVTKRFPDCRVLLLTGHYANLGSARKWAHNHRAPSLIMTKPVLPALLLEEADALLHK
jgi:CheY-like chemotaxis protein